LQRYRIDSIGRSGRGDGEPRQARRLHGDGPSTDGGAEQSPCASLEFKIDLFVEDSILFIRQAFNMASEASPTAQPVKIGTRKSMLARVQTDIVCKELRKAWPDRQYEIHAMSTMGDNNQTTALHEFNAKALWTHELEALLDKGELDLIVHSLKGTLHPPSSMRN
jgi:hypothetical protein